MFSFPSLWIMSAPITVDTFFFMSGLLIVYTSVGKMSQSTYFNFLNHYSGLTQSKVKKIV